MFFNRPSYRSFVTILFKLIQIKGIQSTESTTDSIVDTPATCPISSRNLQVTSEVLFAQL